MIDTAEVRTVTLYDADVSVAWRAIASQDPALLPAAKLPKASDLGSATDRVPALRSSGHVMVGDLVSLSVVHLPEIDSYNNTRLTVGGAAVGALKAGLEEFSQGPERSDYTHLRIARIFGAMRRRHAARRILGRLDQNE